MKNSFTLFETIVALLIITILVGGLLKTSKPISTSYLNLQTIKNNFLVNNSQDLEEKLSSISYINNFDTTDATFHEDSQQMFYYNNNGIYLEKPYLQKATIALHSQVFK